VSWSNGGKVLAPTQRGRQRELDWLLSLILGDTCHLVCGNLCWIVSAYNKGGPEAILADTNKTCQPMCFGMLGDSFLCKLLLALFIAWKALQVSPPLCS